MNKYFEEFKKDKNLIENYIYSDDSYLDDLDKFEAIISLIKEGVIQDRILISRFFQDARYNIDEDDILFMVNENLVPAWKVLDLDIIYKKINDEILIEHANAIIKYAIDNEVDGLVKLLFSHSNYLGFISTHSSNYLIETVGIENIIKWEHLDENLSILEELNPKYYDKVIHLENLFSSMNVDDVDLSFLKKYITYHFDNCVVKSEFDICDRIRNEDQDFITKLILNSKRDNLIDYEFLDNKYEDYVDIFKAHPNKLESYFERQKYNLSDKNLKLLSQESEEITNKIMKDTFFDSDLKENIYFASDYKLSLFNSIVINGTQLNFIERAFLELVKNPDIKYGDISVHKERVFSKIRVANFIHINNNVLFTDIISNCVVSEDEAKEMIKNNQNPLFLLQVLGSACLSPDFIIEIIKKRKYNISDFYIELCSQELSSDSFEFLLNTKGDIDILIKNQLKNGTIDTDLSFFINRMSSESIRSLVDKDIVSINDVYKNNTEEVNKYLMNHGKIDVNFIKTRKVNKDEIFSLISSIEDIDDSMLIKAMVSTYNTEEDILELIYCVGLIAHKETEYVKEILEINKESYVLTKILTSCCDCESLILPYKGNINKDDLSKLCSKYISVDFFIGRFNELGSSLSCNEDSKGIHIYLPSREFIVSYSTAKNKFKKNKVEYTEEDYSIFLSLVQDIVVFPKKLKANVYNDLSFNILKNNEEIETEYQIHNLEELRRWFVFFDKEKLIVDLIRVGKNYEVTFGKMKSKKEEASEFMKTVRKLDVTQIDNLIQDYRNFNPKRTYGIECEFSIQSEDYTYEEESVWGEIVTKKKFIEYVEREFKNFKLDESESFEEIKESFVDYLRDYEMMSYNLESDFSYISGKFTEIVNKFDKKRETDTRMSYRNSEGLTWDLKTDSSVHDDERGMLGVEIASPALSGKSDLNIFKKIMNEFVSTQVGHYEESSVYNAGVHIHHDISDIENAPDISMSELKKELLPIQDMLFNLVDSERSGNSACEKYTYDDIYYSAARGQSINFETSYSTIEFRMKEGTTNVDDIANWAVLTHEITDKICKKILKRNENNLLNAKGLFDKILISAQSVYSRNVIDKSQVEDLFEMYNNAQIFSES